MHDYLLIDTIISLVLAFIMFGVGLSISLKNFQSVLETPKALAIGLISQIFILPLIALLICSLSSLPNEVKVGIIILAACPGGTTSGFITYLFKGNIALSVTFTTINSVITLFSIPFIVNLALNYYLGSKTHIQLPYFETLCQIFTISLLPVIFGAVLNDRKPELAEKVKKPLKLIMVILLAVVFLIKFFASKANGGTGITKDELINILPFALLLNVLCFIWGNFVCKINRLSNQNAYTIAIESSVHNTTLAFLVAGTLLQNQNMVKPSLVYAMFSFWTAIFFSIILKKVYNENILYEFKSND